MKKEFDSDETHTPPINEHSFSIVKNREISDKLSEKLKRASNKTVSKSAHPMCMDIPQTTAKASLNMGALKTSP